ncbi:protein translocase subunit [Steccherinum ochraceum]|uniref:Mitochondrial import inner membrane translocase subunit n=1 Tax=Steccherinum ochraceum TaxID=92696 RepID=A0A4R0R8Q7_9APHY|nr:protein translocase subunit [Steccherinum ochraceum]
MSFLGSSLGSSSGTASPGFWPSHFQCSEDLLKPTLEDMQRNKELFMASVRNEMALLNAQQLINKCNEKCFQKCVTKPGTSLSGSEETCLSRCIDRYLEAFNIVSRSYTDRLKERQERP